MIALVKVVHHPDNLDLVCSYCRRDGYDIWLHFEVASAKMYVTREGNYVCPVCYWEGEFFLDLQSIPKIDWLTQGF